LKLPQLSPTGRTWAIITSVVLMLVGTGLWWWEETRDGSGAPAAAPPSTSVPPSSSVSPVADVLTRITRPIANSNVPRCTTVEGTAGSFPPNQVLWLTIQIPTDQERPMSDGFYIMEKVVPDAQGRWRFQPISIGDPAEANRPFWIGLYLLDVVDGPDAAEPDNRRDLPPTARKLDEVRIVRGEDNATGPGAVCAAGDGA
jgi:hypothetical protein